MAMTLSPSRRTLIKAADLLPVAATGARAAPDRSGADKTAAQTTPVIDCHVHCFDGRDSTRFPYHPQAPYQPPGAVSPEQLLAAMTVAGVDQAVVVHPEPYQDDNRYLEHCLTAGKGRLKGTCLFFADRPAWKTGLPALVKRAGAVVALRVHAYAPERLPPFGKPELKAMWKQAADLGLVMQIHFEPHYAAGFEPLIRAFPKTPVLIDNLGRPFQATPEEFARVLRWSRLPNVHMKLSGFPNPAEYPFRDIRPTLKQIISGFGPDRLVWGGTFGVGATADSYKAGRAAIGAHLADLPAADQAKILGGTAARLFHFATA
jgi:predicted TIM-barrel fold metal-dependent hydrolase